MMMHQNADSDVQTPKLANTDRQASIFSEAFTKESSNRNLIDGSS